MFMKHYAPNRRETRIEVIVKMQKNVGVNVNQQLNLL